MADEKAIIIVKKKGGHGGHHGGAWKVAYADFVTAMMAFFMVMWLVNSAETEQRKAIASYFRKPGIFELGSGTPLLLGGAGILPDSFAPNLASVEYKFTSGIDQVPMTKRMGDEDAIKAGQVKIQGEAGRGVIKDGEEDSSGFGMKVTSQQGRGKGSTPLGPEQLKQGMAAEVKKQLSGIPELTKLLGTVDVKIEADGLNIEIMDSEKQSMFELASSTINPLAKAAFFKIADVLKKVPNQIEIVGHTDGKPFGKGFKGYTNWELSADRANSARRLMEESGIPAERITSVTGRADKELRVPENPNSEQNRRITLKVKFPTLMHLEDPGQLEQTLINKADIPLDDEEKQIVHSMTPEQILKQQKLNEGKTVKLEPSAASESSSPAEGKSESAAGGTESEANSKPIFGDFPVITEGLPLSSR